MSESDDPKLLMSAGGSPLSAVAGHWMEGDTADASAGIQFSVPAGALTAEVYSDVDGFCGPVEEASLDIAGSDMNAAPIVANQWSPQFMVQNAAFFTVKARVDNLALVVIRWGGNESA